MSLNIGNIENLFESINSNEVNVNARFLKKDMNLEQGKELLHYSDLYKYNVLKNINMMKPINVSNISDFLTIREAMDSKDSINSDVIVLNEKISSNEKEFNAVLLEYSTIYKLFMDDIIKKSNALKSANKYLDSNIVTDDNNYIYINKFGFTHKYLTTDSWLNKDMSCPKDAISKKELDNDIVNLNFIMGAGNVGSAMGYSQAVCKIAGQNIQNDKTNEIAWVDIKGYKHIYNDDVWKNKSESCKKYNPIKLSDKAYNNIPSGSPMSESILCSQLDIDTDTWKRLSLLNDKLILLANNIIADMSKINVSNSSMKNNVENKQLLIKDYINILNDEKNVIYNSELMDDVEGKGLVSNIYLKYSELNYMVWFFLAIFLILLLSSFISGNSVLLSPLIILMLLLLLYIFVK